jgi:hypothetical protein
MHIPWFAREYERTCAGCRPTWRVPRWAVHPQMGSVAMTTAGGGSQTTDLVVDANARLAERAAVFRQCNECGSVHYKQRHARSR